MADPVVHLTAGDLLTGLWCDSHALPGRYQVSLYLTSEAGVSLLGTHSGCDCVHEPASTVDDERPR